MKYWFVNQGETYEEERKYNFLYAPSSNKEGAHRLYWTNVKNIKIGDIIFCNYKSKIVSIGKALTDGYDSPIPKCIEKKWNSDGYKVDVEYIDLNTKFKFSNYKEIYLNNINYEKTFTCLGTAKQGYLFPLDEEIVKLFIDEIGEQKIRNFIYNTNSIVNEEVLEEQEEKEQFEKINNGSIKTYSEQELEAIESKKYEYNSSKNKNNRKSSREKTDVRLKATRLELANYLCEVNHEHKTFTNATGKHQYLECHHIIPINAQKYFPDMKLDSMFNIIALCPTCHRKVHHAVSTEKREIFLKLYELRKEEMMKHGFDEEEIQKILNKYYLKKTIIDV